MKEDKENTRPKERKLEIKYDDAEKIEKTKEKKEAMTKVQPASYGSRLCYNSSYFDVINNSGSRQLVHGRRKPQNV